MTDDRTNDEREALIAGDRAQELEPDQAAELPLLANLLADPSTWADPSPGLEDAVVRAVAGAPPAAAKPGPRIASHSRRDAAPRRRRFVVSAIAAAAAIAIVVVAAVALTRGGNKPDYEANLTATALAPGAHATVDIVKTDAGFRVALDASGLPPLQNGEYYQGWLKNAAGALVPIGTFSSSDGRVTLWSGVSPKDYPSITVTIESTDNDQASSGRRVLVGDARPG